MHLFFDLGVPARRQESRYIRTRHQMPPRRRAFRSNDFGLEPTTIPRDAKRQAEPPSRQGAHSRQNHFHCNPSRRLVEHYSRFAANNAHPRLNILPRCDCRQRAVLPHTALLRRLYGVNKILSLRDCSRKSIVYYFYRALAPDGTA